MQSTLETELAFHLSIKHNDEKGGKKKIKTKDLCSKYFCFTCMFEEWQVREVWLIAIQQNYLMLFYFSSSQQESCLYWKSHNTGKVDGKKVETELKSC